MAGVTHFITDHVFLATRGSFWLKLTFSSAKDLVWSSIHSTSCRSALKALRMFLTISSTLKITGNHILLHFQHRVIGIAWLSKKLKYGRPTITLNGLMSNVLGNMNLPRVCYIRLMNSSVSAAALLYFRTYNTNFERAQFLYGKQIRRNVLKQRQVCLNKRGMS